tara:strand:- start:928 stop:1287 length:360 start_codon:yes stop_codon:yes gene_type:complete
MAGMPVLKLTTTGRKSGKSRTVMLTSPLQIEEGIVIVASKGGSEKHPDWFMNLQENPEAIVETQSGRKAMVAKILDPDNREARWNEIIQDFKNYDNYQNRTDRVIPLVILIPKNLSSSD